MVLRSSLSLLAFKLTMLNPFLFRALNNFIIQRIKGVSDLAELFVDLDNISSCFNE